MSEAPSLSPEEARRYARHLVLHGIGGAGQQKLKAARVLVVGAGGLGSPALAYLAAAGVGTLGIADNDTVALSNLQRQIVHTTAGIGESKAQSAARFVQALNPHVTVVAHDLRLDSGSAPALLAGYDVVLDGSDNLATRRAMFAATSAAGLTLVSGAVSQFDGQVTVFPPASPHFDLLFPPDVDDADLPSCEMSGVLGVATGVIGTLMATEAIKLITGFGEPLLGRVLLYDGGNARFTELALPD